MHNPRGLLRLFMAFVVAIPFSPGLDKLLAHMRSANISAVNIPAMIQSGARGSGKEGFGSKNLTLGKTMVNHDKKMSLHNYLRSLLT